MIQLINVSHRFGNKELFRNLNWRIGDLDRVALVGPNGIGKTTLFRMITGELMPQEGAILRPKAITIGHLPQESLPVRGRPLFDEALTAFETVLDIKSKLIASERKLEQIDPENNEYKLTLKTYGELQHQFQDLGGFQIEAETKKVLHGLGFKDADFTRMTDEFSGGWQMRLMLAKLLLQSHAVLLLDEPTNHLDLESIQWLEEYLRDYNGSVVIISHDRYFIDRVCSRIADLDQKKISDYNGNYEDYEIQKALQKERLVAAFEQQHSEIRRIELFVERFRYKARKARQVQSHLKMLERMDKIDLPDDYAKVVRFQFPQPVRSGRMVLELKNMSKQFNGKFVFDDLNYTIYRGDRIALVGTNGAGKSTLCRIIAGAEPLTSGSRAIGHNVSIDYFAQEQADKLTSQHTVYEELEQVASHETMQMLRTILGAFLFSGDDVLKKVAILSGGEKARLAFAKMLLKPTNFLVLDEPTNHIDMQTKDILKAALLDYNGSLIVASHDRYFLSGLVNKVLEVKDGYFREYLGDLSDYLHKKQVEPESALASPLANSEREADTKEADTGPTRKSKEQKRREAQERQRKSVERSIRRKKLQEIELKIHTAEVRKSQLDILLAEPALYQHNEKAKEMVTEYRRIMEELPLLYQEWEKFDDEL